MEKQLRCDAAGDRTWVLFQNSPAAFVKKLTEKEFPRQLKCDSKYSKQGSRRKNSNLYDLHSDYDKETLAGELWKRLTVLFSTIPPPRMIIFLDAIISL